MTDAMTSTADMKTFIQLESVATETTDLVTKICTHDAETSMEVVEIPIKELKDGSTSVDIVMQDEGTSTEGLIPKLVTTDIGVGTVGDELAVKGENVDIGVGTLDHAMEGLVGELMVNIGVGTLDDFVGPIMAGIGVGTVDGLTSKPSMVDIGVGTVDETMHDDALLVEENPKHIEENALSLTDLAEVMKCMVNKIVMTDIGVGTGDDLEDPKKMETVLLNETTVSTIEKPNAETKNSPVDDIFFEFEGGLDGRWIHLLYFSKQLFRFFVYFFQNINYLLCKIIEPFYPSKVRRLGEREFTASRQKLRGTDADTTMAGKMKQASERKRMRAESVFCRTASMPAKMKSRTANRKIKDISFYEEDYCAPRISQGKI